MKTFALYIKNHEANLAPDYEDSCEAETKVEAAKIFAQRISRVSDGSWDEADLIKNIQEEQ